MIYLEEFMSLVSIILQLFCGYNMWFMSRHFPSLTFVLLILLLTCFYYYYYYALTYERLDVCTLLMSRDVLLLFSRAEECWKMKAVPSFETLGVNKLLTVKSRSHKS